MKTPLTILRITLLAIVAMAAPVAFAHGDGPHKSAKSVTALSTEEYPFGRQGNPNHIDRTVTIDMADTMRFSPSSITVKEGQTVRFVVTNKGKMLHEMVIGTTEALKEHAALMQKHPDMEHDEPYIAHVRPGKREDLVWQFTKAGEYTFACLVPGHFEAGMFGKVTVVNG
jgi:uncharacterized cupredoxin-like copper-binding protein